MNNKGFTLIELMVSIALIAVVIVFMFNLLGDIKKESALSNEDISDTLNRSKIIRVIQNDFIELKLKGVAKCTESGTIDCYEFTFNDNSTKRLLVRTNEVEYDNERWVLDSGNYTNDGRIFCQTVVDNNYYMRIVIPVTNHNLDNRIHNLELIKIGVEPFSALGSTSC